MIEPMSVERISGWLKHHESCFTENCETRDHQFVLSIFLRWIHTEARARMKEYLLQHSQTADVCHFDPNTLTCNECADLPYWIAAVKAEIGWPKD